MAKFIIRGARGTTPACGANYVKYGGNTTCFSVHTDDGVILFDAGTGLSHLAKELDASGTIPPITMFFTHFHMDHVIGLPCFMPLYNSNTQISIMADPRRNNNWKDVLNNFIEKPYWPVGLGESDAVLKLNDLPVDKGFVECYGVKITWFSLPHPQQCLSYKVEMPDLTVVVATDMEYSNENIDPMFLDFCRGADYLVSDAQYTVDEYPKHKYWGHSTWKTACKIASEANVRKLILTHHSPTRSDEDIDMLVALAQEVFPETSGAMENMELT